MTFEYFDHEADVGVIGTGKTLEEAYEEGAKGVLELMADVEGIDVDREMDFECRSVDLEALFVDMINDLLAWRDIEGVFLASVDVWVIEEVEDGWRLGGTSYSGKMNREKGEFRSEVKAATHCGFVFEKNDGEYKIGCVVDV